MAVATLDASRAPSTDARLAAFRINQVAAFSDFGSNDAALHYLDQAHGLAAVLAAAVGAEEVEELNPKLRREALEALSTLIELAAFSTSAEA